MDEIIQNQSDIYIGINIGGTKCSVVIGDASLKIKRKAVFDTETGRGYRMILADFMDHIRSFLTELGEYNLKRIGISCGGPLDSKRGIIYSPPNLPGWDNVPVTQLFRDEFGVEVSLQNDANACALAEWLMGAGKGTSNMIFLTFGTGMGGGLILNGKLYCGTNDLSGEVGHIRLAETGPIGFGKAGSFEGFCSGGGIAQLAKSMILARLRNQQVVDFCPDEEMVSRLDAKIVAMAANNGDPVALEIIRVSAEYLGRGLAILIDLLNPECIVIGSIYARNELLFKPIIEKILQLEAIPSALNVCSIKPSKLGEEIGDYAALCVAVYEDKF